MAKEPEQPANSEPKRRLVKKAESIREKTEKSLTTQGAKKPGVIRRVLRFIFTPFRWVGRKLAFLGKYRIVRILGKIFWPTYFRNSWKELRQVTWPTRRETFRLTLAVIIFSTIFGALIAGVDFVLDKVFKQVILK